MSDDLTRRRLTVQVLDLLDASFQARARGDQAEFDRLAQEACALDVNVVSAVQGGIIIGQIPNPEADYPAWAGYVQAAHDQLAAEESGEDR